MEEASLKKIKSIYVEIIGILSQVPDIKENETMDACLGELMNGYIKDLDILTGDDYGKFKITLEHNDFSKSWVQVSESRMKLGGIISKLHNEYFSHENHPLIKATTAGTVVMQSQQQEQMQTTKITMLLEFQSLIDEKFYKTEDLKTKTFLGKLKEGLKTVQNFKDLISLVVLTAAQFNLDIEAIKKIFGL